MIVKGVHDDSEVKQNGRDEREGYRWIQRQGRHAVIIAKRMGARAREMEAREREMGPRERDGTERGRGARKREKRKRRERKKRERKRKADDTRGLQGSKKETGEGMA